MKKLSLIRLPLQLLMLFLQTYFFIETLRLNLHGYIMYAGEPMENSWFAMLFTLLVVVACELLALADGVLLLITKPTVYNIVYFIIILFNAFVFTTCVYYTTVGTIFCMIIYAVLFIARILNLIFNLIDICKPKKVCV